MKPSQVRFSGTLLIAALLLGGCASVSRTEPAPPKPTPPAPAPSPVPSHRPVPPRPAPPPKAPPKAAKPAPLKTTNYFTWDVESNTTSIGNVIGYFGATTRDCTVAHSGACSMRFDVIGNDRGNQQLGADLRQISYPFKFVGAPAIYYRWWMRIEPGFKWGNGTAKTKASRTGGGPISSRGTMAQGYTGYLMSYGFLLGECGSAGCRLANGAINTDGNLHIPHDFAAKADGRWHEYIVKVKPNTSATCTIGTDCDAEFQAWVDGVSVGQYNNFKLHDNDSHTLVEGWGGWMATPYFQLNGTPSDGGTIYVDDFSTDNGYNSVLPK